MSSLSVCALLTHVGYAPVMQISCRDRNRIAIQGDILGGAAMGVCNVLCLTGDGVQAGDHPQAQAGVRSRQRFTARHRARRCATIITSRAAARSASRRACFLGAAANPFAEPLDWRPLRLGEEDRSRRAVHPDAVLLRYPAPAAVHDGSRRPRPLDKAFLLDRRRPAALGESGGMDASTRTGLHIPDAVIARLKGAQDQTREGRNLCVESDPGDSRDPGRAAAFTSWPTDRKSRSPR